MSIVVDNVLYAILAAWTQPPASPSVTSPRKLAFPSPRSPRSSTAGTAWPRDTSARVKAVIDDLGYEASLVAQSLRNHRTNVIGILVADLEPFSAELLKGAADAIRGSGFEMVIYSAGGHAGDHVGWERRYLSRLSGTLIDGAVLVTPTVVDVNYGAPIVAIDPHTGQSGLPTIDSDSLRGGQLATAHLLGLGHRRIAMLRGRPDLESSQLREQGYREALPPPGSRSARTWCWSAGTTRRPRGMHPDAADRADPPTAIFAANDVSAIAAIQAAAGLGLRVPATCRSWASTTFRSPRCAPPR